MRVCLPSSSVMLTKAIVGVPKMTGPFNGGLSVALKYSSCSKSVSCVVLIRQDALLSPAGNETTDDLPV